MIHTRAQLSGVQEGAVQKHDGSYTSVEAIRKRFIQVARDETRAAAPGGGSAVAVCRLHGRPPRLLPPHAFNQLCEVLADRLEGGMLEVAPDTPTPSVLQAYVQVSA